MKERKKISLLRYFPPSNSSVYYDQQRKTFVLFHRKRKKKWPVAKKKKKKIHIFRLYFSVGTKLYLKLRFALFPGKKNKNKETLLINKCFEESFSHCL